MKYLLACSEHSNDTDLGITIITNSTLLLFKWYKEVKDTILSRTKHPNRLVMAYRTFSMVQSNANGHSLNNGIHIYGYLLKKSSVLLNAVLI